MKNLGSDRKIVNDVTWNAWDQKSVIQEIYFSFQSVDRLLEETLPSVKCKVLGNAPMGVKTFPFKANSDLKGGKLFILKAQLPPYTLELESTLEKHAEDLAWVTRKEINSFVTPSNSYRRLLRSVFVEYWVLRKNMMKSNFVFNVACNIECFVCFFMSSTSNENSTLVCVYRNFQITPCGMSVSLKVVISTFISKLSFSTTAGSYQSMIAHLIEWHRRTCRGELINLMSVNCSISVNIWFGISRI